MDFAWGWFTLAAVLVMVEIISPTFYFIWPGMAAGVVGVIAILAPDLGFDVRLIIFAVLTCAFAWGWKIWLKKHPTKSDDEHLNNRAAQMIGQTGMVIEEIKGGKGRVQIGDSAWLAKGSDCPAGTPVKVLSVEGTVLVVSKN